MTPLVKLLGWNSGLVNWTAERIFPEQALYFFGSPKYITKPHLPADYQEEVGKEPVEGIVHVEAGWNGKNPVDETRWLEGLNSSGPGTIKGIVAFVDLTADNEQVEQQLKDHIAASSKVCGIRDMIAWHENKMVFDFAKEPYRSKSTAFRESFPLLAKCNLTFETMCYSPQLDELVELAEAFPEQKILVDHVGVPAGVAGMYAGPYAGIGENDVEREQIIQDWKASMIKLGRCPNAYCKVSGFGMPVFGFGFANEKEPPTTDTLVEKLSPFVLFCIQVFGARRCIFGSNFPVDKVSVPNLDTYIDVYKRILATLPTADQEMVFRGTAIEFYGLGEAESVADEEKVIN